jgi:NAD kinase
MTSAFDKVVVVIRKTALEELVRRFNTRDQARFYVEHMGASFDEYQAAHDAYRAAVRALYEAIPDPVRSQWVQREFLPTFTFGQRELVVTLGNDGLVVNTAKYLSTQPLLAINPDPLRVDGVLVPFGIGEAGQALRVALGGGYPMRRVTMARARLNDGQTLDAVNDLFIGQKTHVSARYRIRHAGREEPQSSSGIIVSTGAGSTGWLRSVLTGSVEVVRAFPEGAKAGPIRERYQFDWEAAHLVFSVREPFVSKLSSAGIVFGRVEPGRPLEVVSQMPQNGVIFSDGVEEDNVAFNSGAIAEIGVADRKLHLLVPGPA